MRNQLSALYVRRVLCIATMSLGTVALLPPSRAGAQAQAGSMTNQPNYNPANNNERVSNTPPADQTGNMSNQTNTSNQTNPPTNGQSTGSNSSSNATDTQSTTGNYSQGNANPQTNNQSNTSPMTNSQRTANFPSQPLQLPAGLEPKYVSAESGVKSTLVGLTNRAVDQNSYNSFFGSFLSELAKHDQARAKEFKGVDQKHLNALIDQIQNGWQAKYGQKFDVTDKNLVFSDQFPIVQGHVIDPAMASSNWPVMACIMSPMPAGAEMNGNHSTYNNSYSATDRDAYQKDMQTQLSKGEDVAIIRFPAGCGMPSIDVSLIHHAMAGWYVSVPEDRTGQQIYDDLTAHLEVIASHQDKWPADVSEGYSMVARHVVAALYGVQSPDQMPQAAAQ